MPKRVLWGLMSLLLSLLMTGAVMSQTKLRTVRLFIPDASPTRGTAVKFPFYGTIPEIRYLQIIAPDRLPVNGGTLTGITFFPVDSGRIAAKDVSVMVALAGSSMPNVQFNRNLMGVSEVFRRTALRIDGIVARKPITLRFDKAYTLRAPRPLVIQIRFRGLTAGVRMLGASSRVRAIYTAGAGAYGSKKATFIAPGLKTGLDLMTSQPTVTISGSANPGSNLGLSFNAGANIGDAYLAGCAFTTSPGIDIGEYTVPLNPDPLFYSVWQLPTLFQGFAGQIGFGGFGSGSLAIPNESALVGVSFAVAFVTFDSQGPTNVSMESWVTIGSG